MAVAAKLILLYFSKAQQSYYSKPPREQPRVSPHGKPELAGLKRNLKIAFDEIELESVAKLAKLDPSGILREMKWLEKILLI